MARTVPGSSDQPGGGGTLRAIALSVLSGLAAVGTAANKLFFSTVNRLVSWVGRNLPGQGIGRAEISATVSEQLQQYRAGRQLQRAYDQGQEPTAAVPTQLGLAEGFHTTYVAIVGVGRGYRRQRLMFHYVSDTLPTEDELLADAQSQVVVISANYADRFFTRQPVVQGVTIIAVVQG
jgi:hypothetical protein